MKGNLEQRRNTFPLYPTPLKANMQYPTYRMKETGVYPVDARHPFSYFSDPMLNTDQILRSQLAANGYMPHSYTIRQAYGLDRVCCGPWWGIGGRRKGGQVRFSAAQTGALERRFTAGKYLSPEERRALAASLRLSDRQVKTWFQNRRAKWRRTTSDDAGDPGSPPSDDEGSDDDVQIAVE
ncbi:homeobox domain-containing protein [Phthorimaea operculella]|nr:homeobox domain-containing protein [Phthorimaea operculella]